jgi:lysophospholipase L1-like esterase
VAFGDSLTTGEGSTNKSGYRDILQAQLAAYFGQAFVVNAGRDGTFSTTGAARIPGVMSRERPAYTLIFYGTNDWNDQFCQSQARRRLLHDRQPQDDRRIREANLELSGARHAAPDESRARSPGEDPVERAAQHSHQEPRPE